MNDKAKPAPDATVTERKSEAEITNDLLRGLIKQNERLIKQNERLLGEIDSVNGNLKTARRHPR